MEPVQILAQSLIYKRHLRWPWIISAGMIICPSSSLVELLVHLLREGPRRLRFAGEREIPAGDSEGQRHGGRERVAVDLGGLAGSRAESVDDCPRGRRRQCHGSSPGNDLYADGELGQPGQRSGGERLARRHRRLDERDDELYADLRRGHIRHRDGASQLGQQQLLLMERMRQHRHLRRDDEC